MEEGVSGEGRSFLAMQIVSPVRVSLSAFPPEGRVCGRKKKKRNDRGGRTLGVNSVYYRGQGMEEFQKPYF